MTAYIDFDEALSIYARMVEKSGGGLMGIREEGGIRKVLDFVRSDDYYPTVVDKTAYILDGFCSGHFFLDGNKRIALTLSSYFLLKNGYFFAARTFMAEMEAITYHVAAGHMDRDLLVEVIQCIVDGIDYPEALKLDLMQAMDRPLVCE